MVKWSSSKNDGQNILTPVLAVTTAHMGVTTPWCTLSGHTANLPRSLGLSVCLCYVSRAAFVPLAMRTSTGRKALETRQILQRVRTIQGFIQDFLLEGGNFSGDSKLRHVK